MNRKSYPPLYFVKQAFSGLFRNVSATLGTVLVLICCLVLMGSFYALVANISVNLDELQLLNKIVVFLDYDATDDDAERIEHDIKSLRELGGLKVTYVSKEQGLEDMKRDDPDNAYLYEDIPSEDNPLADSFIIEYTDASKVQMIEYNLRQIEGIRKVNSRSELALKVNSFKNGISVVFLFFFIVLLCVSVFVIINTVRMTVFARRDEIYVMRFVGAARWFIYLPFLLEGVIIGGVSACAAFYLLKWLSGYIVTTIAEGLDLVTVLPFASYSQILLIGCFGIGVLSGIIGSTISIRRPLDA